MNKNRRIRKKVFESNSSSMHSIVVTKGDEYLKHEDFIPDYKNDNVSSDEWLYIRKGKLVLYGIENGYGRHPFRILFKFEDKLKYAMCEYLGWMYPDDPEYKAIYDSFIELVNEIIPEVEDFEIDMEDFDIYLDKDGNEILHKNLKYDYYDSDKKCSVYIYTDENGEEQPATLDEDNVYEVPNIGNIDHQSMGLLKNFLKDKGISLKEFLTNKKYKVIIDGDEYCDWLLYKSRGMGFGNIDYEYDRSGEDIEYEEWLKDQEEVNN